MVRRYRQTTRAMTVEETRRKIVAAARKCILTLGYQKMRFEDVARYAKVSRASVFRHFRNKAEILRAVEADAASRAGVIQLVETIGSLPPRESLHAAIREGSRIWAAETRVFQEFYGTAPFDDTLRPLVGEKEALRHSLVSDIVTRLDAAGLLGARWQDTETVANAVWLLTGFGTFDALTRVRGLSTGEAAAFIEETICTSFL